MKAWRPTLGLVAVVVCGCIKADPVLELNRDGSGTIELKYSILEKTIEQFRAMHTLREELDKVSGKETALGPSEQYAKVFMDATESGLRGILKKYEANGLTVRKLKIEARNVSREVTLKLEFDDLARLAKCDLFQMYGFNLRIDDDGHYLFERPAARKPVPEDKALTDERRVKILREILGGFRVAFRAEFPGRVLASNATQRGGRSVMWAFDFNEDPRSFAAIQTGVLQAKFESGGIDLPEVSCRVGQK